MAVAALVGEALPGGLGGVHCGIQPGGGSLACERFLWGSKAEAGSWFDMVVGDRGGWTWYWWNIIWCFGVGLHHDLVDLVHLE